MDIDEYITTDSTQSVAATPDLVELHSEAEAERSKKKSKAKPSTQMKEAILADKHELIRKRDILISVSVIDGLESYIGETYTAVQIRNMKKEKLESIFLLYQEKAAQKTTNETMSFLVEMSVKGLSHIVNIDNKEEMTNDLLVDNPPLRKIIGKQVAEFTEKFGDVVAYLKVFYTVGKHISFSPFPTSDATLITDSSRFVE